MPEIENQTKLAIQGGLIIASLRDVDPASITMLSHEHRQALLAYHEVYTALLDQRRRAGASKSRRKADAARANGKKGGWPKGKPRKKSTVQGDTHG